MANVYPLNHNRLSWIDYNRGISIILICYFHLSYLLYQYYHIDADSYWILKYSGIFLYGFRMPLFFLISGIFLQKALAKKGLQYYINNRFNTIFYPLLIWGVIKITLQLAAGHLSPKHGGAGLYFDLLLDPRKTAPFWYLHALFCISVLYAIVKVKFKLSPLHNFALGLVLYLISDYVTTNGVQIGFPADIFKYYVFFSVGDLITGVILSGKATGFFYSGKFFFLFLASFILVQSVATKYNTANHDLYYVENKLPVLYLLQGLAGCAFSIYFSFLLQKWNALPVLKTIGSNSLYIYCMHYIVIIASCIFCIKILHLHNTLLLIGICWFAAVALPILFYKLSMKLNLWWLFSLNRPKDSAVFAEMHKKSPPVVSESLSA